ncbi:aldolase/citrate lyase family protein [Haliea sp.]
MRTLHNSFKHALREGGQQYGFWLGLCSPLSAELCGLCGYDWLLIDAEHAPNDLRSVHAQLLAIGNTPSHPVVRLVEGDAALIKQMLDLGVQSLLIPSVETADQARALVATTRYPPKGVRGVGTALARVAGWNLIPDYFANADNEICLLLQVESVRALENLEDILTVDGVDGVFIGPADLAASMGHLGNPTHTDVVHAVESALQTIRSAGRSAGTLVTSKTLAHQYERAGAQFVALGVDTLALAYNARNTLESHLGDREHGSEPQGNGAY